MRNHGPFFRLRRLSRVSCAQVSFCMHLDSLQVPACTNFCPARRNAMSQSLSVATAERLAWFDFCLSILSIADNFAAWPLTVNRSFSHWCCHEEISRHCNGPSKSTTSLPCPRQLMYSHETVAKIFLSNHWRFQHTVIRHFLIWPPALPQHGCSAEQHPDNYLHIACIGMVRPWVVAYAAHALYSESIRVHVRKPVHAIGPETIVLALFAVCNHRWAVASNGAMASWIAAPHRDQDPHSQVFLCDCLDHSRGLGMLPIGSTGIIIMLLIDEIFLFLP